jgi:plasmid stability protein
MAQLLVRNLDEETIKRLKALARQHGRSLQGQVKLLLEEAAVLSVDEASAIVEKWQRRLAGRRFSDSAKLVREDRRR